MIILSKNLKQYHYFPSLQNGQGQAPRGRQAPLAGSFSFSRERKAFQRFFLMQLFFFFILKLQYMTSIKIKLIIAHKYTPTLHEKKSTPWQKFIPVLMRHNGLGYIYGKR